jgi:UDP-N-acetylmuramoylalanine--D-glutamate ligase
MDALQGLMDDVVALCAATARPGDVVLLSPAAASLDMFPSYGSRGDVFADAVRRRLDRGQGSGA